MNLIHILYTLNNYKVQVKFDFDNHQLFFARVTAPFQLNFVNLVVCM